MSDRNNHSLHEENEYAMNELRNDSEFEVSKLYQFFDAVWCRDIPTIDTIITGGLSVNARHPEFGDTALMCAADIKWVEGVQYFLRCGCDINARNKLQLNALDYAVNLIDGENTASKTEAMIATIHLLLKSGIEFDTPRSAYSPHQGGDTPLFTAAASGNITGLHILLGLGANLHRKQVSGFTPLFAAIENEQNEMLEELLKNGLEVNDIENALNTTPLYECVYYGNLIGVQKLLEYGADPNLFVSSSPLHLISKLELTDHPPGRLRNEQENMKYDIARLLLSYGSDVNAIDSSGKRQRIIV